MITINQFSTAEFTYRTCANGPDRKGRGYHVNGPDSKLYSVLCLSSTPRGESPVAYEVDGIRSQRLRTHVDIENHYRLSPHLEAFQIPSGHN